MELTSGALAAGCLFEPAGALQSNELKTDILFNNHIISYKLQLFASAKEMSLKIVGLKSTMTTNQQC